MDKLKNIFAEKPESKSVPAPAIIQTVSFDSDEFLDYISTPFGYVTSLFNLEPKGDEAEFEWHEAQLAWLTIDGHKVMNKCRQMGGSTVLAAEELALSQLINKDYAFIFFSIKKEEAQNKIAYIKEFMHNLPLRFQRKIIYETKQSIEFLNRDGTTTKIISHAQKPSRGLHGNSDFDEADFYQDFRLLYDAALPGTRKVEGSIKVISTPNDPVGLFRELLTGTDGRTDKEGQLIKKFENFTRMSVVWWDVPFYCKDVDRARKIAPRMSTRERVYEFGTRILINAYEDSRTEETFQQEYECFFPEKDSRFFSMNSLKECSLRDVEDIFHEDFSLYWNDKVDLEIIDNDNLDFMFPMERHLYNNKVNLKVYGNRYDENSIYELISANQRGEIKGELVVGIDIGTTGHSTDILIAEEIFINGSWNLIPRFNLNKNKWALPDQQKYIVDNILKQLPIRKIGIDTNGIGAQIGQYVESMYPYQFEDMPMRVSNLDRVFNGLRECLEARVMAIPAYEDIIGAIYSVKRNTTELNTSRWVLQKTKTSHADCAISYGIAAALFLESKRGYLSARPFESSKNNLLNVQQNTVGYHNSKAYQEFPSSIIHHNSRLNAKINQATNRGRQDLASIYNKLKIG